MNKNKLLICVGLIALLLYSWYTVFSTGNKNQAKYDGLLASARKQSKAGVVKYASEDYIKALAMLDTIDIRVELLDCYLDNKEYRSFVKYSEECIEDYPKEIVFYEKLLAYRIGIRDFTGCYKLYQQAMAASLSSEYLQSEYDKMKYEYKFAYTMHSNISDFFNGYTTTQLPDGTYLYVDLDGEAKKGTSYKIATPFNNDGEAVVMNVNNEVYIINKNGEKLHVDSVDRNITDVKPFYSYGFAIQVDGKYTYVDKEFNNLGGCFEDAGAFVGERAVAKLNGKWYIINQKFETFGPGYDEILMDHVSIAIRHGVAFAKDRKKYILINSQGEKIGNGAYDDADVFFSSYAAVKLNGKWGFIDSEGNMVIEPQYDEAKSFAFGYAAVCKNGEWFYIDEKGNKVIEGGFAGAMDFHTRGRAFVLIGENWKLLELYSMGN